MAYNTSILKEALKARSIKKEDLSNRLGIDREELDAELRRLPSPRQSFLNDIANELSLPAFAFYMDHLPEVHESIPDFRSSEPKPSAKTRQTIETIRLAEGIQKAVEADPEHIANLPFPNSLSPEDIDAFALIARKHFQISVQDQIDCKDARAFFIVCRKRIEDKGIFVLQDSFPDEDGSGLCLYDERHPVIVVNTKKQTYGRRLFTLLHELGHVLLRQSGISDPFIRNNRIERICNRFAGSFLIPAEYLRMLLPQSLNRNPDRDEVRWAANKLKVSQEATAFRLELVGLYQSGTYEKWKSLVHNNNPDYANKSGGRGGPPPQDKVKLSRYGTRFARSFEKLLRSGAISEIQLYRTTGLKPKYLSAFFELARTADISSLQSMELDDD